MYFSFDFGWYSIHFDIILSFKNGGGKGVAYCTKSVKRD